MQYEAVYARILARVAEAELRDQCRDVAEKDASSIDRRLRSATRALQHAYDVDAARRRLSLDVMPTASATLVADVAALQSQIDARMRQLMNCVSRGRESTESTSSPPEPEKEPFVAESKPDLDPIETAPTTRRRLKRRLSRESIDSPRKPPRPGRLATVHDEDDDDEATEEEETTGTPPHQGRGPHAMPNITDDEETEDDVPMHLDVLDSDTEFEMAAYLEKARHLRKISSERRMGELPGLIHAVLTELQRHEWSSMPRELLGTLSATLGAATTLKPEQRRQLHAEISRLHEVAMRIDETTARRYPTLLGSRGRFLSSLADVGEKHDPEEMVSEEPTIETITSVPIEELHVATTGLANAEEVTSLEQITDVLRLVDHVFDNPTLARSDRYRAMVTTSLDVLIQYVSAIPRNTRRKHQCQDLLHRRRAQLTGHDV